MNQYEYLANSVVYLVRGSKTVLVHKDPRLKLIGEGRSAFAFLISDTDLVLKVFFPEFHRVAAEEAAVYEQLAGSRFFPKLHGSGSNYLVIDYVRGLTLYQCLVNGRTISPDHIEEVDHALKLARENGLNPSDIHLRNIIITPDNDIKLIDVARFRQSKDCSQWKDLKTAFYKFYMHERFPRKLPQRAMDLIAFFYKKGLLPSIN